jgi:hypothetical protein
MAQRLETALRRPLSGALRATPAPAARPATNQTQPALDQPHPAPAPAASPVVVPALDAVPQLPAAASATAQSIRTETATYENLQREMASLLGRKPGSS